LTPGSFDANALYRACRFDARTPLGPHDLNVNVFDTGNIKSTRPDDDPDLGSPNRKCKPSGGPGVGSGGIPSAKFPNCDPLGNVLILQNRNVSDRPNDDPTGGCILFDWLQFYYYGYRDGDYNFQVSLLDFGLLDIEEGATINVRN
jgi:hypothetical protein